MLERFLVKMQTENNAKTHIKDKLLTPNLKEGAHLVVLDDIDDLCKLVEVI